MQAQTQMDQFIEVLRLKFSGELDEFLIPPPVFKHMQGELIGFDQDSGWLETRFPIQYEYLNPYRLMQGGMIAAAIDNTLGPLSILVAPPNVTRSIRVKYSAPISTNLNFITIRAQFEGQEGKLLKFRAVIRNETGGLLARAQSEHWIIDFG